MFAPDTLIGDTVLFTPVNLGNLISRIVLGRPYQPEDSLRAVYFSKLMSPYLVTNEEPI